jgi:hypothetical protein
VNRTEATQKLLNGQAEMLFDGPDTLLQPLYRFLNLAIGDVCECAGFSELLFKEGSIFGMTPVEMHLKSSGNKLKFVTEPLRQNTSVPFGVRDVSSKRVGRCRDELLDLRERFLIHDLLEKTGEV